MCTIGVKYGAGNTSTPQKWKIPGKGNKRSINRQRQQNQSKQPSAFQNLNGESVVIEQSKMEWQI
jgi:hypothetical protein